MDDIKELVKTIKEYAGTSKAEAAKVQYDIIKLEEERIRNKYLFRISILLFVIAIANVAIAIITFLNKIWPTLFC